MLLRRSRNEEAKKEEAQRYRDQFVTDGIINESLVKEFSEAFAEKHFIKPDFINKTKQDMAQGVFNDIFNKITNH